MHSITAVYWEIIQMAIRVNHLFLHCFHLVPLVVKYTFCNLFTHICPFLMKLWCNTSLMFTSYALNASCCTLIVTCILLSLFNLIKIWCFFTHVIHWLVWACDINTSLHYICLSFKKKKKKNLFLFLCCAFLLTCVLIFFSVYI